MGALILLAATGCPNLSGGGGGGGSQLTSSQYTLEASATTLVKDASTTVVFTFKNRGTILPNTAVTFTANSTIKGLPAEPQTTDSKGQITVTLIGTAQGNQVITATVNGQTVSVTLKVSSGAAPSVPYTPPAPGSPTSPDVPSYPSNPIYPPPATVTVTFNSNGGDAVTSLTVTPNSTVGEPAGPTRSGANFGGWYKDNNTFRIKWNFASDTVTANITLYARWVFTDASAAAAYLTGVSGGGSAGDPIGLSLDLSLGATAWSDLLTKINNSNKYVNLDLSACTDGAGLSGGGLYSNGTFDPDPMNGTGKDKIVSITLPDDATEIAVGYYSASSFLHFSNLQSVSAVNVDNIGDNAFEGCTSLNSVSFPEATTIGDDAFRGCTSLNTVSFPEAMTIGDGAFINCTSLSSASFPEATTIGDSAFFGCDSLNIVSFPVSVKTSTSGA